MYLSSVSRLIHDGCTREELFEYIMHRFLKVYVKYTALDGRMPKFISRQASVITVHLLRYVSCALFDNRQCTNGI